MPQGFDFANAKSVGMESNLRGICIMLKTKEYKLKYLTEKITKGTTPSNIGETFTDEGIMYFRSELIGKTKYVDKSSGLLYISESTHEKLKRSQIKENDMLFSMAGIYLGKISLVSSSDIPANTNQAVAIIRFNSSNIDLNYVYYYMTQKWYNSYINSLTAQAAQPNINLEQIGNLKLNLPDIKIQSKIAKIISRYDEAIENNNKRIKLLEQMAQNLYKEWFVRFRFPGWENTEFENGIPKGWKVEKLFDVVNVTYGYAFASELFCEDKTLKPVVRIRDILDNRTNTYTSEVCADKYIIKEHEILVGMDGIFHMCMWNGNKAYQNQRVVKLTSKTDEVSNYFLFLSVQPQVKFWEQIIAGTTVAHLGDKHLKRMTILLPSENLLKESTKIFNSLMKQKNQLFIANENLAKQRDLLLPRLMSGKLEV